MPNPVWNICLSSSGTNAWAWAALVQMSEQLGKNVWAALEQMSEQPGTSFYRQLWKNVWAALEQMVGQLWKKCLSSSGTNVWAAMIQMSEQLWNKCLGSSWTNSWAALKQISEQLWNKCLSTEQRAALELMFEHSEQLWNTFLSAVSSSANTTKSQTPRHSTQIRAEIRAVAHSAESFSLITFWRISKIRAYRAAEGLTPCSITQYTVVQSPTPRVFVSKLCFFTGLYLFFLFF